MKTRKRTRVYELFPYYTGFSTQGIHYQGHIVAVAAVSLKQALWFAYHDRWAKSIDNPSGIIWLYARGKRGGDTLLPNGKWKYGIGPRHNEGKRAIQRFMKKYS